MKHYKLYFINKIPYGTHSLCAFVLSSFYMYCFMSLLFMVLSSMSFADERDTQDILYRTLIPVPSPTTVLSNGNLSKRRIALLIGNQEYDGDSLPKLKNPHKDIVALQKLLSSKFNFETNVVENAEFEGMRKQITDFFDLHNIAEETGIDIVLFFYAGHGIQVDDDSYLLPINAKSPEKVNNFEQKIFRDQNYYNVNNLIDFSEAITQKDSNKKVIIIIDACRDTPFKSKGTQITVKPFQFARHCEQVFIAFSTSEGKKAQDGNDDEDNSVYMQSLIKNLVPDKKMEEVFLNISSEVQKKTKGEQIPTFINKLRDQEFILDAFPELELKLIGEEAPIIYVGTKYEDKGATAISKRDGDITAKIVKYGLENMNTDSPGIYKIIYEVEDSVGVKEKAIRIVNVIQPIEKVLPPVITINGQNPVILKQGDIYKDLGASARSEKDGDLSDKIKTTGADKVNTAIPNNYEITYEVMDSTKQTTTAKRVVIVEKVEQWEIILKGEKELRLEQGKKYTEPGFVAKDNKGMDLSKEVRVEGDINENKLGLQIKLYILEKEGILVQAKRKVEVIAKNFPPPVITINGQSQVILKQWDVYKDLGATARSEKDGDLSDKIKTTGVDKLNTDIPDKYEITYEVVDSIKQVSTATRVVLVEKVDPPTITLKGKKEMALEQGTDFIEPGWEAKDGWGNDLSNLVMSESNYDKNALKKQYILYKVQDKKNRFTQVKRMVEVIKK